MIVTFKLKSVKGFKEGAFGMIKIKKKVTRGHFKKEKKRFCHVRKIETDHSHSWYF